VTKQKTKISYRYDGPQKCKKYGFADRHISLGGGTKTVIEKCSCPCQAEGENNIYNATTGRKYEKILEIISVSPTSYTSVMVGEKAWEFITELKNL